MKMRTTLTPEIRRFIVEYIAERGCVATISNLDHEDNDHVKEYELVVRRFIHWATWRFWADDALLNDTGVLSDKLDSLLDMINRLEDEARERSKSLNSNKPTDIPIDPWDVINESMEHKDRSIYISITPDHTHISINPYDNTPLAWKPVQGGYECPNCKRVEQYRSRYCPWCGDELAWWEGEKSDV